MIKRTLSALIAMAMLFALICLDILSELPLVEAALLVLLMMALYEMYRAFGFTRKKLIATVGFLLGVTIFSIYPEYIRDISSIIIFAVIVMFIIAVTYHKTVSFSDISALLFTTLYISLGMLHIRMLYMDNPGLAMIFIALIAAFITDTGAYFTGFFFGKHKLIPEISPKKTVEGAIGGVVIAVVSLLIYAWILTFFGIKTNILNIIIVGVITSVGSQFGDLSASMIKRELKIKDYGDLMPGHGGVLDRVDSLLFAAPLVFYLNIILPILSK